MTDLGGKKTKCKETSPEMFIHYCTLLIDKLNTTTESVKGVLIELIF